MSEWVNGWCGDSERLRIYNNKEFKLRLRQCV